MKAGSKVCIICSAAFAVIFVGGQVERGYCRECYPPEQQDALETDKLANYFEVSTFISAGVSDLKGTLSAYFEQQGDL